MEIACEHEMHLTLMSYVYLLVHISTQFPILLNESSMMFWNLIYNSRDISFNNCQRLTACKQSNYRVIFIRYNDYFLSKAS